MNFFKNKIQFNRNEISGAFGDIGTDLPLILGMILAAQIDGASVFIVYGIMQLFSGFAYGIPMAVQPLKAIATIVIAKNLSGDILFASGLIVGLIMLFFTLTGLVKFLSKVIPTSVIKGVQFGLALTLANIALGKYIFQNFNFQFFILIVGALILGIIFLGNRKYPPAYFILGLGLVFSLFFYSDLTFSVFDKFTFVLPEFHVPNNEVLFEALVLLALPQIPLSIGNSILASNQIVNDLFPEKKIKINKISFTYSIMNIVSPFFGGIPVCHGSGGLVGHYNFGARTGGSVVFYGIIFLIIGLFFSSGIQNFFYLIPIQILGVILLFESFSMIKLLKIHTLNRLEIYIIILVGLIAFFVPYGFLVSMIVGTFMFNFYAKKSSLSHEK
jgi:MFS superfamily sulfate permease-like transporter